MSLGEKITMETTKIFDLKNGYLQMGWECENTQGNLWQTFIESMLIKNGEENAFLATNCRAENIVSEGKIFGGKLADVSVIKGWDKNLIIRAGPGLYHPFRPGQSKTFHCAKFEYGVKVVAMKQRLGNGVSTKYIVSSKKVS